MSLLARAEMAESKLRAIKGILEAGPPYNLATRYQQVLDIIDTPVWDGYQTLRDDSPDDEALDAVTFGGDDGPHSRGCGYRPHDHGWECAPDCPTCDAGRTIPLRDHKEP